MKLADPYKAATTEDDATVLPHPDLPGCSSFRRTGVGGEPANANATALRRGRPVPQPGVPGSPSSLLYKGGTVALCPRKIG
jgi:hypothetical protein